MRTGRHDRPRRIGVLALPGVQMLDVAGPLDVFAEANRRTGEIAYELSVIGVAPGPIVSSSGGRLMADATLASAGGGFDTLLVAGAPHLDRQLPDQAVIDWVRDQARRTRRMGSVCSGAWILAAAGLLDGRRIATHWETAEPLQQRFPAIRVDVDALHVADGPIRTSGGVTAGLDLALALVEEDLGREVAKAVASQLVMFFRRPGGQLQFSRRGQVNPGGRTSLQQVQHWALANLDADLSTPALAKRAGLSGRHFARLFLGEIGVTPAAWVEMARIDAARMRLEAGRHPKQAAAECGYQDADTFRRAFVRRLGVTPAEYRRRYDVPGSLDADAGLPVAG